MATRKRGLLAAGLLLVAACATSARAQPAELCVPLDDFVCEATGGDTWQQLGVSLGLPAGSGSATDGIVSTAGDQMQRANRVGVSTSDTAQPLQGEHLHVPRLPVSPPSTTTTSTVATTTTTTAATTTSSTSTTASTAAPTTTQATTTTSTAPSTTSTVPTTTTVPSGGGFFADFSTPGDFYNRFQTEVFFGIDQQSSTHHQWIGDHSVECGNALTARTVIHNSHADDANLFWWCAPNGPDTGHVMTSVQTEGYAQVLFAPNQTLSNVTKVCWDQSMKGLPRKWTQVVIVPESLYQANGGKLHYVNPGVLPVPGTDGLAIGALPLNSSGEPDGSNLTVTEQWARGEHGQPRWNSYLLTFTNGSISQWSRFGEESYFHSHTAATQTPRYKQCITDNGNGTVTHVNEMPSNHGLDDKMTRPPITLAGEFPDGPVRVIFQDDTYDSFKTDAGDPTTQHLGTWHWDNISIT